MRDYLILYVNGERYRIGAANAFLPLAHFLREQLGFTGLKIVCGEGACGACTVLVGKPPSSDRPTIAYKSVNSCLHPLYQVDCCHTVTVEGLTERGGAMTSVQEAMVAQHGSQCGYCTPGVVMSLTGLFDDRSPSAFPNDVEIRTCLSGNLCRCTGYLPILDAAQAVDIESVEKLSVRYPEALIAADLIESGKSSISLTNDDGRRLFQPRTLYEALEFLTEQPNAVIAAGGTGFAGADILGSQNPILSLSAISELHEIKIDSGNLVVGAMVNWTDLHQKLGNDFPQLTQVIERVGSPQLRNTGTIGGSVAHAEGNGDILPLLLVSEATLQLTSVAGTRTVLFSEFLTEKFASGELLTAVCIPLPNPGEKLRVYKVRRRQGFDRSLFCAAVRAQLSEVETIDDIQIACGGVGPKPMRLPQTEAQLRGQPFDLVTLNIAGPTAADEVTAVDDSYASAEYRRQLAANLLTRFFHDIRDEKGGN